VEVGAELVHHQFFDVLAHGFSPGWIAVGVAGITGSRIGADPRPPGRNSPLSSRGRRVARPIFRTPSAFLYPMTRMPGLMVAETVIERMYAPLAAAGLMARRWFRKVLMFSTSCSSVKLSLPTGAATLPPLSLRNSILPAL